MKKNTRRWLGTELAAVMALTLILSGCSGNDNSNDSANNTASGEASTGTASQQANSSGETTELTLAMPTFVEINDKEFKLVAEEINKITKEKINATLKFEIIPWSNWQQQTNLMVSAGEKLDIMPIFGTAATYAASGKIIPLDDLIKQQGQDIANSMDEAYLNTGKINGKLYTIPVLKNFGVNYQFMMRKDLVEKNNIDVASIKTFADVENVLKTIKDKEPSITPIVPNANGGMLAYYNQFDTLGDSNGILLDMDKLEVSNQYESSQYKDMLTMFHRWYQEGYILKDAATNQITANELVKSGKGFSYFNPGGVKEVDEAIHSNQNGTEMVSAILHEPVATTSTVSAVSWAIAQNSKHTDKAMQMLNLLYSNKEIVNLLDYGIEGKHYVKISENMIDNSLGAENNLYNPGWYWMIGNMFLSYVQQGGGVEDQWEQFAAVNETANKSKALGFTFNSDSVKTEITAITNVKNQFALALETGTLDPEKVLPDFIKKLKAAGMDKVVAEKQKQLDEWAKNNNVN